MNGKTELTQVSQEFIDFFSQHGIQNIKNDLKRVFQVVTFDTDIASQQDGRDSLFTLYQLIELVEQMEIENNPQQ